MKKLCLLALAILIFTNDLSAELLSNTFSGRIDKTKDTCKLKTNFMRVKISFINDGIFSYVTKFNTLNYESNPAILTPALRDASKYSLKVGVFYGTINRLYNYRMRIKYRKTGLIDYKLGVKTTAPYNVSCVTEYRGKLKISPN